MNSPWKERQLTGAPCVFCVSDNAPYFYEASSDRSGNDAQYPTGNDESDLHACVCTLGNLIDHIWNSCLFGSCARGCFLGRKLTISDQSNYETVVSCVGHFLLCQTVFGEHGTLQTGTVR